MTEIEKAYAARPKKADVLKKKLAEKESQIARMDDEMHKLYTDLAIAREELATSRSLLKRLIDVEFTRFSLRELYLNGKESDYLAKMIVACVSERDE